MESKQAQHLSDSTEKNKLKKDVQARTSMKAFLIPSEHLQLFICSYEWCASTNLLFAQED